MKYKILNSKDYNLNSRVVVAKISTKHLAIVKKRKSRIIMKDGTQIMSQINEIKIHKPDSIVSLIISGPICSKTTKFLTENNVQIIKE